MKKIIFVSVFLLLVFSFIGCSNQTKPPMTYKELLSYKGTNESLYKYLILTSIEDETLFNIWCKDIDDTNLLIESGRISSKKLNKVGLLQLFYWYYKVLDIYYLSYVKKGSDYVGNHKNYENTILERQIRFLSFYITEQKIKINNDDIEELTNFFLSFPFD